MSLAIGEVKGPISEYLDCTPAELHGHGWRPFLHPDDRRVIVQLGQELQVGVPGAYQCRAQARTGDPILHIRVRTLIVQEQGNTTGAEGCIDLLRTESRRTILVP